jgi:hypothetical protein
MCFLGNDDPQVNTPGCDRNIQSRIPQKRRRIKRESWSAITAHVHQQMESVAAGFAASKADIAEVALPRARGGSVMTDNYKHDIEDIRDRLGDVYAVANEIGDVGSRLDAIEERQEQFIDALNQYAAKLSELISAVNRNSDKVGEMSTACVKLSEALLKSFAPAEPAPPPSAQSPGPIPFRKPERKPKRKATIRPQPDRRRRERVCGLSSMPNKTGAAVEGRHCRDQSCDRRGATGRSSNDGAPGLLPARHPQRD